MDVADSLKCYGRARGLLTLAVLSLLVGLVLGPLVLGRTSPVLHQQLWWGGRDTHRALDDHRRATRGDLARLAATGVTEAAVSEWLSQASAREQALIDAVDQDHGRRDRLLADMRASLVIGLIGTLVLRWLLIWRGGVVAGTVPVQAGRLEWLVAVIGGGWLILWLGPGSGAGAAAGADTPAGLRAVGAGTLVVIMALGLVLALWPVPEVPHRSTGR